MFPNKLITLILFSIYIIYISNTLHKMIYSFNPSQNQTLNSLPFKITTCLRSRSHLPGRPLYPAYDLCLVTEAEKF